MLYLANIKATHVLIFILKTYSPYSHDRNKSILNRETSPFTTSPTSTPVSPLFALKCKVIRVGSTC